MFLCLIKKENITYFLLQTKLQKIQNATSKKHKKDAKQRHW